MSTPTAERGAERHFSSPRFLVHRIRASDEPDEDDPRVDLRRIEGGGEVSRSTVKPENAPAFPRPASRVERGAASFRAQSLTPTSELVGGPTPPYLTDATDFRGRRRGSRA